MTTPSVDDFNPALCDAIARHIASSPQHRITFAEYMEIVLYHPQHGYYATNAVNIGSQGDFFTSPHLGGDFGELLAEQFVQMWEIMGRAVPFTLLEMGAGQGILAADILKYLHRHYPDFFEALEYAIVERSSALRKEQQQRLQKLSDRLRWVTLEEIPPNSLTGCCFSNELVDAMPVHQFLIEGGQLREIYVTTQGAGSREQGAGGRGRWGDIPPISPSPPLPISPSPPCPLIPRGDPEFPLSPFVEVIGEPSTSRLTEYFDLVKIELPSNAYPDGYRSEVNLAALDWLSVVAERLHRGYLLTIDYGYPASRYYTTARQQGTLQCYYRHLCHHNPYIHIGRQDITAHVDFTALELWGERCGLHNVGFTQQALFLMALGLGDAIAALSTNGQAIKDAQGLASLLQRREALHQLIDPLGLGGFGVLVQSKGLAQSEAAQPLKGLSVPPI